MLVVVGGVSVEGGGGGLVVPVDGFVPSPDPLLRLRWGDSLRALEKEKSLKI